MDRYTKIVLTVIAGALLLLNLQLMRNVDFITNAYAQSGGVQKIAICDSSGDKCAEILEHYVGETKSMRLGVGSDGIVAICNSTSTRCAAIDESGHLRVDD